jgi:hypothetical protein
MSFPTSDEALAKANELNRESLLPHLEKDGGAKDVAECHESAINGILKRLAALEFNQQHGSSDLLGRHHDKIDSLQKRIDAMENDGCAAISNTVRKLENELASLEINCR